jgi:P pilus assembly chaperone PapD
MRSRLSILAFLIVLRFGSATPAYVQPDTSRSPETYADTWLEKSSAVGNERPALAQSNSLRRNANQARREHSPFIPEPPITHVATLQVCPSTLFGGSFAQDDPRGAPSPARAPPGNPASA